MTFTVEMTKGNPVVKVHNTFVVAEVRDFLKVWYVAYRLAHRLNVTLCCAFQPAASTLHEPATYDMLKSSLSRIKLGFALC